MKDLGFIGRFVEVCGTGEASEIQRLLNLPYQTVRNYLGGRLPNPDKLILISAVTGCSIDWLLTGRGEKLIGERATQDTPVLAGQMEAFVRRICIKVLTELAEEPKTAQAKSIKLPSNEILSENVVEIDSSVVADAVKTDRNRE
jgi:Helix-turn-helix